MGTEQPLFMAPPLERLLGGEVGGRGREREKERERQRAYLFREMCICECSPSPHFTVGPE